VHEGFSLSMILEYCDTMGLLEPGPYVSSNKTQTMKPSNFVHVMAQTGHS